MSITLISIRVCHGRVSLLRRLENVPLTCPQDWSLPDQLLFSTVNALLNIASVQGLYRDKIVRAIIAFVQRVVQDLNTGEGVL
jgi:hypothetical protein